MLISTIQRAIYSRSRSVPCQSQEDWAVAAVIVVVVLFQSLRNHIVHVLVVFEAWAEDSRSLPRLTEQLRVHQVEAVSCRDGGKSTSTVEHAIRVALVLLLDGLLRSIAAALVLLAEGLLRCNKAGGTCRGVAEGGRCGAQSAGECSRDRCHCRNSGINRGSEGALEIRKERWRWSGFPAQSVAGLNERRELKMATTTTGGCRGYM